MVEDIFVSKFLMDMLEILRGNENVEENFKKYLINMFGIEKIDINLFKKNSLQQSSIEAYVYNTKKVYIDNEINEYSAFPELLNFKNMGYSSCLISPIKANEKIIGELRLFSTSPNKFTSDISNLIELSTTLFGLNLDYNLEIKKIGRITDYFDATFNSEVPHAIINSSNVVVKFNKAFINVFKNYPESKNINDMLGIGFTELSELTNGKYLDVSFGKNNFFRIYTYKISSSLILITLGNLKNYAKLKSFGKVLNQQKLFSVFLLDNDYKITALYGNLYETFDTVKNLLIEKNIEEVIDGGIKKELESVTENGFISDKDLIFPNRTVNCNIIISKYELGYVILAINNSNKKEILELNKSIADFIKTSSDIIMQVNEFGYIIDCNETALKILGYNSKTDLLGKDIKSIYYDNDLETLDTNFKFAKDNKPVDSIGGNIIKRDGSIIPIDYSIRYIDSEEESGYLFIIRNLETTMHLKDIESELHKSELQAKRFKNASDMKSEFIYNITHELKTPLTNIKGFTELMKEGEFGSITDQQIEYLNTILEESDRLMLIISQVLDAAKLEADKVKLDLKMVNLKELYNNQTIKSLEESAKNKGLTFTWDVSYDIPEIEADFNRLIQVLVNLIGNSIKFTEKGGITIKIFKKSRRYVQFEISDTGIGIGEDDKRKIFKKFYQAQKKDLIKPDGTGTGLGLAITKDIIALQGGKIKFDSVLGKGTKFWFTLPITHSRKKN